MFDAPNDTVAPLLEEAKRRGWNVIGLWLTHGHFDHIADAGRGCPHPFLMRFDQ